MMKILTAREITIHQGVKIATMSTANIVPHMLAPHEVQTETPSKEKDSDIKLQMKSTLIIESTRSSPVEGDTQGDPIKSPR